MKLTVLGCATPYPRPNRPCSGYLLSAMDTTILLDCGPGVFAALLGYIDPRRLSAVWISHMHPDHSTDLAALANWALNTEDAPKIRILGPENWDTRLNAFISADPGEDIVSDIFDVEHLEDGTTTTVGGLKLTSRLVQHSVRTFGVRVADELHTFAYSGDTGMCAAVATLASNADMFLCEAGSDEPAEYHMTAEQAHEVAQKASVRNLLITHVPDNVTVHRPADSSIPSEVVYPGGEWSITRADHA